MDNILFFDTETTGKYNFKSDYKDKKQPYICQLGAILTDKDGHTLCELNVLISPSNREDWNIEIGAQNVHGISKECCEQNGMNPKMALEMFNYMIGKSGLIVGHNIKFDLGMVKREAFEIIDNGFISALESKETFCTMDKNTNVLKLPGNYGYKYPKLQETYKHYFGENFEGAHDAMADIRATRDIYFKMNKEIK